MHIDEWKLEKYTVTGDTMKIYFPILLEYVGPNQIGHLGERIRILSAPSHTNMSGEIRTNGWLGTTDDWSKTALGEMNSSDIRDLLLQNGVKIPATTPIRETDYSINHKNSEWYNLRHAYPA